MKKTREKDFKNANRRKYIRGTWRSKLRRGESVTRFRRSHHPLGVEGMKKKWGLGVILDLPPKGAYQASIKREKDQVGGWFEKEVPEYLLICLGTKTIMRSWESMLPIRLVEACHLTHERGRDGAVNLRGKGRSEGRAHEEKKNWGTVRVTWSDEIGAEIHQRGDGVVARAAGGKTNAGREPREQSDTILIPELRGVNLREGRNWSGGGRNKTTRREKYQSADCRKAEEGPLCAFGEKNLPTRELAPTRRVAQAATASRLRIIGRGEAEHLSSRKTERVKATGRLWL